MDLLKVLDHRQDGVGGFNVLLKFFVRRLDKAAVEGVVKRMREMGIKKDKFTVSTLATFLVRTNGEGEIKENVERLVKEMEENDIRWDDGEQPTHPKTPHPTQTHSPLQNSGRYSCAPPSSIPRAPGAGQRPYHTARR